MDGFKNLSFNFPQSGSSACTFSYERKSTKKIAQGKLRFPCVFFPLAAKVVMKDVWWAYFAFCITAALLIFCGGIRDVLPVRRADVFQMFFLRGTSVDCILYASVLAFLWAMPISTAFRLQQLSLSSKGQLFRNCPSKSHILFMKRMRRQEKRIAFAKSP